jgi:two-component system NtrC family response regulator
VGLASRWADGILAGDSETPWDNATLASLGIAPKLANHLHDELAPTVESLREREGDVLLLARHFLDQIARHENRTLGGFSQDALTAMEGYAWPGNVRELKNRIKRAVIMTEGTYISAQDLELSAPVDETPSFRLREARDHAERQAVLRALGHVGGKVSEAAELLGVSRPTLYDMIRKFRLKV